VWCIFAAEANYYDTVSDMLCVCRFTNDGGVARFKQLRGDAVS